MGAEHQYKNVYNGPEGWRVAVRFASSEQASRGRREVATLGANLRHVTKVFHYDISDSFFSSSATTWPDIYVAFGHSVLRYSETQSAVASYDQASKQSLWAAKLALVGTENITLSGFRIVSNRLPYAQQQRSNPKILFDMMHDPKQSYEAESIAEHNRIQGVEFDAVFDQSRRFWEEIYDLDDPVPTQRFAASDIHHAA